MRIGSFVAAQSRRSPEEGVNICGLLIQARPDRLSEVTRALSAISGLEIAQQDISGKIIVTVEDTAEEWAGQIITRIPETEGVLSTTLIYHHCEAGDLEEEIRQ